VGRAVRGAGVGVGVGVGDDGRMLDAVIVVVVLLLVLPAVFWLVWGAMGWLLGRLLTSAAEATHEGSELIATNR
jgi:phosphotransferase system  glucose/maltose/N-acetylglucosamine-specific IIC component